MRTSAEARERNGKRNEGPQQKNGVNREKQSANVTTTQKIGRSRIKKKKKKKRITNGI